jgi:dinuclear metal center YbgI/SA1388 family protein
MRVADVARMMESWAPREIAWERDNVGLQIGDPSARVRGILVALDISEGVLREAYDRRANLVISHHPLLFRPPRNLTAGNPVTACVSIAARHDIAVYAAHTNLDFTSGGTSFALAELLGLEQIDFLVKSYKTGRKVVTYVPVSSADNVVRAMASAGAGRIGNYDLCSFRTNGVGTFRGNERSNPSRGQRERFERVEEVRLEMIADSWNVRGVVKALMNAHPYEEPAYEIYPTENISNEYGIGTVGTLKRPKEPGQFLRFVKGRLRVNHLRYGGRTSRVIRRVALCGGSGSDLLDEAIARGADAFVTADVKYHTFHDAAKRILIIDAGHYETEVPVVSVVANRLRQFVRGQGKTVPVNISRKAVNPIMYV